MIGLDTNVLVRLLVEDDPEQAAAARRLVAECGEQGETCWVALVVVCELEWVLESAYGASRRDVARAVEELLGSSRFTVEASEQVHRAVAVYRTGRGDLSDLLIGESAAVAGARTTFTFDRALRDDERFTLLR